VSSLCRHDAYLLPVEEGLTWHSSTHRQPMTVKVDEPAVAFLPPLCLHNATLDLDWSFRLRIT